MSVPAPSRSAAFAARLLVVLALVVVSAPLLGASPASAVVDGGFEIDGDLTASTNLDWSNVPGQPAMRDLVSAAGDDGFKSGQTSKEEEPDDWDLVTAAVTPNANDIGDIYGYGRLLDGHQWAFVGFERAATGGSTSFNIEFNARRNKTNVHGVSVPDRQAGDILIDIQQQGSGSIVVGGVYQWSGSAWVYSPAAAAVVSSAYNTGTVTDVDGSSLPTGRFAEISIDITKALGQASACPGLAVTTLNIRSRSSASSITSTLKDYIKPAELGVPTGCGGLTIAKKDGTGAALPGAAFSVSPNPVAATPATLTVTDGGPNDPDGTANGTIAFGSVKPGSYTVIETAPPTGYLYSTDPLSATVTAGVTTVVPVVNRLGSASWTKVDATSKDKVGGATFTVTGTGGAAQTLVGSPVTVVDNGARDTDPAAGAITVAGLPTGTYAVRETVPPTGYDLPTSGNPQTFSVTQAAPNPALAAFSDPRRNGSVTITKTDAVSGAALDATFRLWRDNGDDAFSAADTSVAGPAISTGGTLTFGNLPWGTYWVEETVPPTGYLVDPNLPRRVVVNASSLTPTVAVADPRRPSTLTVSKVDDADGRPLADARMKLWRDSDGVAGPSAGDTAVDTCDTTAAGTCSVDQVGFGTFYWQEVTPPPDYLLPATPYSSSVTISAANAGTALPVREFRDVEIALAAHLTKSGTLADLDGDHLADVGEVVTYTFTLRNDGNAPLTGLAVIDPKVGAVTCPAAAVPVGGSAQCTATYPVTQADVDHGSVDNAATATATGPNGATTGSNEALHSLPVDESSSVQLEKAAELQDLDGDGLADEGETIRFVFTVTNTGNDSLHGATVDDPTLGAVSCPAGTFAPRAHVTCTKDYVVTANDVDNGSVANVATAAALDTDGSTVSSAPDDTVTPTDTPTAIRLVKTGSLVDSTVMGGDDDGKADVGEVVTWTFQVFNDGKATLHDVAIDDPSLGPVTCLVTTVAPGTSVTCVKSSVVSQADVDRGEVVNVATASGTPTGRPTVTSEESGDRIETDTRTALSVVKAGELQDQDGDGLADRGETVDYTFTVTNDGTTTLHGITVDDPRVASVDCPASDLLPGKSVTCTASYVVTQADVDHGSVDNTATASALDPSDAPLTSDESSDSVDADHRTAVALVKSATLVDGDGDDLADAGETIAYRFEVSNTGTTTVHDVRVDDPRLAAVPVAVTCPAGAVLPGAGVTCSASYVVTQADVDAGTVHNVATASAAGPGGTRVPSAGDEADVATDSTSALSLVKEGTLRDGVADGGDGDGLADAGETVDYTFTVANEGTTTVRDVTVDDPRLATVDCPTGNLLPGRSVTCTASYVVTQADVDHGSVDNAATASATPATGPAGVRSGEATDTLPADARSALSVTKSGRLVDDVPAGDGDGLADRGETVTYAFVVTNDGTTTLRDVAIDDPKLAAVPATVSCPTGAVLPGHGVTCTASYVVTQADVDHGVVRNVATATAAPPAGPRIESARSDDELVADVASGLAVVKTGALVDGDDDRLADEGETVDYTFEVTNTGTVTVSDVRVDDPRVAAVDCPAGDLLPGSTLTCTGSLTVTRADVDGGAVVNTATATADGPGGAGVTSPESTETLPADDLAAVGLAKHADLRDADLDGKADRGETVDYRFVVTNGGHVTLHDVVVDDPKVASVDCPAGDLLPGASVTCTASYVVTQADVDHGSVDNVATASAATPHAGRVGSAEAEAHVPADTRAALTFDKRAKLLDSVDDGGDGDGLADAGERIDFTFVVTNDGAVSVSGVTVDDPMLAGLPVPVVVSCPSVVLAPGESLECSAAYTVRQADVDRGEVANVASASGVPAASSPGVDSQPDTTHTSTDSRSAVSVTKSASLVDVDGDHLADEGERVDYAFEVHNDGTTTLHEITVDDPRVRSVDCPAGDLAPGDSVTCTASYVVTQADVDGGVVRNVATASAVGPDDVPVGSAPSDAEVAVDGAGALTLLKTGVVEDSVAGGGDGDGLADEGETIAYAFAVRNAGNVTLAGVAVDDPRIASVDCPAGALAPGASVTCTGTYVVTQADVDAGQVVNTAAATARRAGSGAQGGGLTSNESTETLPADATAGLSIAKSATLRDNDGDDRADRGERIDYTFDVTNTGTVTMTAVSVVDPMLGDGVVTCPATTLAPGASMTCTASHRVTDADLDDDEITNVAWAVGTPLGAGDCGPDGCESEPDSASVPSEQTTVVTEPGDTPGPGKHGTSSTTAGGSTPKDAVLPNTGGPAAGLAGLGLLAVLAGLVALVRGRRRDEEGA